MKPEDVKAVLGDLPNMGLHQGRKIAEFLQEHNLRDCLELGFNHGVSSAYIAAALQEMGGGSLTTIDHISVQSYASNIEVVLEKLGLQEVVTYFYEPTSYLWRLMRMLEEDPTPHFDFCYLDGAHSWAVDGFAFLLVNRLLRPGGWIIFDDLDWSYAASPAMKGTDFVESLPIDERETPQVRKIWELLVKTHPSFDQFWEDRGWAFARKSPAAMEELTEIRREVVFLPPPSPPWKRFLQQIVSR